MSSAQVVGEESMAADDESKTGSGVPNQGGSDPSGQPPGRKQRPAYLDTQSLRALAPKNEVARSALEMRQNLEKFLPPGPQRDELIAQLKRDVTPILGPELDKKQAELGQKPEEVLEEREKSINDAIDRAAQLIRDKLGQFETFGPVKEVIGVPAAVIDHLRAVLHDPRRNKGEFQIAVGLKDGKHFSSSRYFEPSALETFAYERLTSEGLSDLQISGYGIKALIHAHQCGEGKDATHFSNADIEQADSLQTGRPDIAVQIYLLTPAPENIVIVYSPNVKDKLPLGEAVGFFAENGNFVVRNDKYAMAFQDTKLIAG
jgi:hypothetical protein